MSTGADCQFIQKQPDEWVYKLQKWPYGENPDYDEYGPFKTYRDAENHLSDYHANPGGFSVHRLDNFDCDHEEITFFHQGTPHEFVECDICGRSIERKEI